MEKALFVPLRREWFDAFARGEKQTEYRRWGPRWNERTCRPGRAVTLSLGYSGRRLRAVIAGTRRVASQGSAIFEDGAMLIAIDLTGIEPALAGSAPRVAA